MGSTPFQPRPTTLPAIIKSRFDAIEKRLTTLTRQQLPASNTVRFRGAQIGAIATASNVNMAWSVIEDTNSGYDATNKQYVIPFDGAYMVSWQLKGTLSAAGSFQYMINGAVARLTPNIPAAAANGYGSTHVDVLSAGDILALQPRSVSYTSQNETSIGAGVYSVWLEVIKL